VRYGRGDILLLFLLLLIHKDGTRSIGLNKFISRGDVIVVPKSVYPLLMGNTGLLQTALTVVQTILTIEVLRK